MPEKIDDPEAVSTGTRVDNAGVVEPPALNNSRGDPAGKGAALPICRPFVVPEIEAMKLKNGYHYLPCPFDCDVAEPSNTPFHVARRPAGTLYSCRDCGRSGLYRKPYT